MVSSISKDEGIILVFFVLIYYSKFETHHGNWCFNIVINQKFKYICKTTEQLEILMWL